MEVDRYLAKAIKLLMVELMHDVSGRLTRISVTYYLYICTGRCYMSLVVGYAKVI